MICPSCSEALRPIQYEGVEICTCEGCGGEFLGPAEMTSIVNAREARFSASVQEALRERRPIPGQPAESTDWSRPQRSCPACDGAMSVINYGGDTGIHVDRCADCGGLWLDHEELENIQVLLEHWQDAAPEQLKCVAGELEIARRLAAERTKNAFSGSRFSFVNALINRLLDAA